MRQNCPACGWSIQPGSTRCPHCTSIISYETKTGIAKDIGGFFGSIGGAFWGALYGGLTYILVGAFMHSDLLAILGAVLVFIFNVLIGYSKGTTRSVAR